MAWFLVTFQPITNITDKLSDGNLKKLIKCWMCMSFWLTILYVLTFQLWDVWYLPFASSMIASLIDKNLNITKL